MEEREDENPLFANKAIVELVAILLRRACSVEFQCFSAGIYLVRLGSRIPFLLNPAKYFLNSVYII